jgi:hypothetical protein
MAGFIAGVCLIFTGIFVGLIYVVVNSDYHERGKRRY